MEINITRTADMRGYLIEGAYSIAYIKKHKLFGGFKWIPVKAVIIRDRTFMHSRLRVEPIERGK